MVWVILLLLGIPLWFVVTGIVVTIRRNRALRARPGNVSVRMKRPGATRWQRGNAVWVSDVFLFRASPAAWGETAIHVSGVTTRKPDAEEQHTLRRLGPVVCIVTLSAVDEGPVEVAVSADQEAALTGAFASATSANYMP